MKVSFCSVSSDAEDNVHYWRHTYLAYMGFSQTQTRALWNDVICYFLDFFLIMRLFDFKKSML